MYFLSMRSEEELRNRLAFVLASSFRNVKERSWDSFDGNVAKVKLNSDTDNFYMIVIDHSGSGLVKLDGSPYFELDSAHRMIPIPKGNHDIVVEFSPYRDFGEKTNISPGRLFTADLDFNAYRIWVYGEEALSLARVLNDPELRDDMYMLLTNVLKLVPFTTLSKEQIFLAWKLGRWVGWLNWIEQIINPDLTEIFRESEQDYSKALMTLLDGLNNLRAKYGKRGKLNAVGHAHIDTAWLWPFDETRRKVLRTFSTMLTLMDKYADFTFIQSMAIYYEWIKEDSPQVFERIKQKVREGRWQLGAGYVEFDANMTSGESIARQLLYSQRFYLREFGKLAEILWLPDSFGFNANLPQIARLSGVNAFATYRTTTLDTNTFPYSVYYWIDPAGGRIRAISFGKGNGGYNADFSVNSVIEQWRGWIEKEQPMLYSYGYGDGGGGPSELMLIRAEAIDKLPILPKVSLKGATQELVEISPKEEWKGILYVENFRGTYTSHSMIKYLNRKAEVALRDAELWSTLAGSYDRERFQSLWKIVMKNQFHDVLPGSAIREVYKVAYTELQKVIEEANRIAEDSMRKLAGEGETPLVFNSLPWDREEVILLKEEIKECHKVNNLCAIHVKVPGVGYSTLRQLDPNDSVTLLEKEDEYLLENKFLRIKVNKKGRIMSIYDKEAEREILRDESNIIKAYENIPGWADAWLIEKGYKETSFDINASESSIVSKDPLVAGVKFLYKFRRSEIIQTLYLYANSRRIDFVTTLRMKDRELTIKSWFNFDLNVDEAIAGMPFGVIKYSTLKNTSWDLAKFEVPFQQFVDMSEYNYGVALLAEAKYGISLEGSSMGLTLTRTPIYPDPSTDLEELTFTYSIYPHKGDWKTSGVLKKAYELNIPLKIIRGKEGERTFIRIDADNIMLETVKLSEDDNAIVLRLYEYFNSRGKAIIMLPFNVKDIKSVNILESDNINRDLKISDNSVEFSFGNNEVITLKLYKS